MLSALEESDHKGQAHRVARAPVVRFPLAAASLPMGKLGQPDEIADFVVFLPSDRSGVVTGSVIDWDQDVLGGFD